MELKDILYVPDLEFDKLFESWTQERIIESYREAFAEVLKESWSYFEKVPLKHVDFTYIRQLLDEGSLNEAIFYCEAWLSRKDLLNKRRNMGQNRLLLLRGRAFAQLGDSSSAAASFEQVLKRCGQKYSPEQKEARYLFEEAKSQLSKDTKFRITADNVPDSLEDALSNLKEITGFFDVVHALNSFYLHVERDLNLKKSSEDAVSILTKNLYNSGTWPSLLLPPKTFPIFNDIYAILEATKTEINESELFNGATYQYFLKEIKSKLTCENI